MNHKRYWLRGGIIGIILAILYFPFQAMLGLGCMKSFNLKEPSFICDSFTALYSSNFLRFLFSPLGLIILGLIIGWIYGRSKNRKNNL